MISLRSLRRFFGTQGAKKRRERKDEDFDRWNKFRN